eukprot:scaffold28169_cov171-Skeletonema_menzelii.AAC.3
MISVAFAALSLSLGLGVALCPHCFMCLRASFHAPKSWLHPSTKHAYCFNWGSASSLPLSHH